MTHLLLGEAARYECLHRDSEARSPLPKAKSNLRGYGIRHTITKRWYAGSGRWRSKYANCCWNNSHQDGLWYSPEEALRSLRRYFRKTEIALVEAVPLYKVLPEDFEEVVDVWCFPYRLPAGRAIPLK